MTKSSNSDDQRQQNQSDHMLIRAEKMKYEQAIMLSSHKNEYIQYIQKLFQSLKQKQARKSQLKIMLLKQQNLSQNISIISTIENDNDLQANNISIQSYNHQSLKALQNINIPNSLIFLYKPQDIITKLNMSIKKKYYIIKDQELNNPMQSLTQSLITRLSNVEKLEKKFEQEPYENYQIWMCNPKNLLQLSKMLMEKTYKQLQIKIIYANQKQLTDTEVSKIEQEGKADFLISPGIYHVKSLSKLIEKTVSNEAKYTFISSHSKQAQILRKNFEIMINQSTGMHSIGENFMKLGILYIQSQLKGQIEKHIEQFIQEYHSIAESNFSYKKIFEIYTKDTHFHKVINNILRQFHDPLVLFYLQPFIRSMHMGIKQIYNNTQKQKQYNPLPKKFTCYRGCTLKRQEIKQFYMGKYIQNLCFLSTTLKKCIAKRFFSNVMLIIEVNQYQYCNQCPSEYCFIQNYSQFRYEQQILFNTYSTFQILKMERKNNKDTIDQCSYIDIYLKYIKKCTCKNQCKQNMVQNQGHILELLASQTPYEDIYKIYQQKQIILKQLYQINRIIGEIQQKITQNMFYSTTILAQK